MKSKHAIISALVCSAVTICASSCSPGAADVRYTPCTNCGEDLGGEAAADVSSSPDLATQPDVGCADSGCGREDGGPVPRCGDGECGDGESCSSCVPDCGECPSETVGPRERECEGVRVEPGADIQALVDGQPAGMTYCLAAGTHSSQSIVPKTGDQFIGELGAVLDGQNISAFAFSGRADRVTIENLVIENYDNPPQLGVIKAGDHDEANNTTGWIIQHNEVRYCTAGIRTGHETQVRFNHVHHQFQLGIGGSGRDVLIEGNEISECNFRGDYDPGWEAGASKWVATRDLVVRNNYVHDNQGFGLWTDINNVGTTYEGNLVEHNLNAGIFHEISYDAVIRNNTLVDNGYEGGAWLWNAGIQIAASENVEVYGNDVSGNANAIAVVQQRRCASAGEFSTPLVGDCYLLRNVHVHDNTVDLTTGGVGFVQDIGDASLFSTRGVVFENNTYSNEGSRAAFAWDDGWKTHDEWRAIHPND